MTTTKNFPGFHYSAAQLSAFLISLDIFVISLKNTERVIIFTPEDKDTFKKWLLDNKIRDITQYHKANF